MIFLTFCVSILLIVFTGILWHLKYKHLYFYTKDIPGPPTFPFIGNALQIGKNPVDFFNFIYNTMKTYGPVSRMWIGSNKIYIFVSDHDFLEHLLSSPKYIRKSSDYKLLNSWLGNGLLISTGSHWQKRRKIITPTFHFKILEEFIPVFNMAGETLIKKLSEQTDKDLDIYPFITAYTLDVICETAMGTSVNAQNDPTNEYCTAVRTMGQIFIERTFSFWKQYDTLYRFAKEYKVEQKCLELIHNVTKNVIESRRTMLLKEKNQIIRNEVDDFGGKKRIAFLDLLLQSAIDGVPLSDEDIAAEVNTFMFEGHDTTSSALSFTFYELGQNPEVQKKILDELRELFLDDINKDLTLQDLNNLKYVECVAKEALRLYPAVPYMGRELEEDVEFKGRILPKGANISIVPYFLHRNPDIYPEPEKFIPERFAEISAKHPFAYLPFSAGPRNCIGQKFAMNEIKTTIVKIVRRFEILPVQDFVPVLGGEGILKSANGIFIKLKERNL